jgi:hypothetical protein
MGYADAEIVRGKMLLGTRSSRTSADRHLRSLSLALGVVADGAVCVLSGTGESAELGFAVCDKVGVGGPVKFYGVTFSQCCGGTGWS